MVHLDTTTKTREVTGISSMASRPIEATVRASRVDSRCSKMIRRRMADTAEGTTTMMMSTG